MLKSIPFLHCLGRTAVGKFSYFFSEVKFVRGSFVFKEKQEANHIYIIKSGEFEMLKSWEITNEAYNYINRLDNQGRVSDSSRKEYFKNQKLKFAINNSKQISVTIMTRGQLFGEHDIISSNKTNKE